MSFIKLFLLLISNIGYYTFLERKTKIEKLFIPICLVAVQIVILFIAGLFNILLVTSIIIYIIGILLFIKYIYLLIKKEVTFKIDYNYILFFLFIFLLYFLVKDMWFTHYDDFSHWALVVKTMLINNRIPNALDTVIDFKSYPLGSSLFIYYFSKMVGNTEGILMLANNYIILCALLPLTKYIKNKISYIFFLVFINFIFCLNIRINSLLVDTLLPCFAFATLFFIHSEKENSFYLLYSLALLSTLILIKNSAIYFVVIDIIYIIYIMLKKKDFKNYKYYFTILSPIITIGLWKFHLYLEFSGASFSKHSVSLANYFYNMNGKTGSDIILIINKIIEYILHNKELYLVIITMLITSIFLYFSNKTDFKKYRKAALFIGISYVIYVIGLVGMYILSMPINEAKILAGIERYIMTYYIYAYLIIAIFIIKLINCDSKRIYLINISIIILMIILNYSEFNRIKTIFEPNDYNDTVIKVHEITKDNNSKTKYLIYDEMDPNGYKYYLYKYAFYPAGVGYANKDYKDEYKDYGYNYYINFKEN